MRWLKMNLKIIKKCLKNYKKLNIKKFNNKIIKIKLISAKGLTKGLINNYSILNSGKYFGENESQIYLVYIYS